MDPVKRRRLGLTVLIVILVLIVVGVVGPRVAVKVLTGKVAAALGPGSEVSDIRVSGSSVKVVGLRIKGPAGWPAADALRADEVVIVPSLRGLFAGHYRVSSITIVRPYLSAFRNKEGKFLVVPGLQQGSAGAGQAGASAAKGPSGAGATPHVTIGRITLKDGVVEFYDATVAEPPLKIRLEELEATVHDVKVPGLAGKSKFELKGIVKGVERDGQVDISGWAEFGTKDSSVDTRLRGVDLIVLQDYLVKPGERGVRKGTLDLDLQSSVTNNRLNAPGKVTISNLELASAEGKLATFMGLPRDAVMAFLTRNGNKITVEFLLEGDVNNPKFSLNQTFAENLAFSMAKAVGVNLGSMVKGVGGLGQKGGEAAGQAAKGAAGALQQLIGGKKKH